MTYLIGQAPDGPCPVCDIHPVALREVEGFPEIAECIRCAFAFTIRNLEGDRLPKAVPSVSSALAAVFRQYYEATGRKLGLPAIVLENPDELDPERAERSRALDEWLKARPGLLSGAMAPASWPFVSLTALRIEVDGRPTWQILAPPTAIPMQLLVPMSPENVPPGTLVTVSIPIDPVVPRPASEIEAEAEGNA